MKKVIALVALAAAVVLVPDVAEAQFRRQTIVAAPGATVIQNRGFLRDRTTVVTPGAAIIARPAIVAPVRVAPIRVAPVRVAPVIVAPVTYQSQLLVNPIRRVQLAQVSTYGAVPVLSAQNIRYSYQPQAVVQPLVQAYTAPAPVVERVVEKVVAPAPVVERVVERVEVPAYPVVQTISTPYYLSAPVRVRQLAVSSCY